MSSPSSHGAIRAGGRPAAARPALSRRIRWPAASAGVFLALTGLLAWGAAETDYGDTQNVIAVLSTACFVFFWASLAAAVRQVRKGRRGSRLPSPA